MEYRYKNKVKVINGFYTGIIGTVEKVWENIYYKEPFWFFKPLIRTITYDYMIEVRKEDGRIDTYIIVNERDLELIK